jgi:hypothetical protein
MISELIAWMIGYDAGHRNATRRLGKKNPHVVALGRNGGKARKAALTPERRSEIACQAVIARWDRVRAARVALALKSEKRKRGVGGR